MLKLSLCVLLIGFTTFSAYILSKKFKVKRNFYYDFYLFNDRLINEVSFVKTPLMNFCGKYSYESDFNKVLNKFISENNNENIDFTDKNKYLKKDEKKFIKDYFSMLGKSDASSQKNYLLSSKQQIDTMKNTAETDCQKYGSMYVKLGFLLGLLLVIIIY